MAVTPPRASLQGIPPELRNNIFNRLAADLDEVSIIGCKLSGAPCSALGAANRMWNAIAKHPLSQTCRMLRREFNPIHRYHVMTKGVPKYILELEDYDVDHMERLGDLIVMAGPLLEQLRTKLTAEKFVIRFLLNGHVVKSVRVLSKYAQTPGRLGSSYANLKGALPHGSDYWSWEVTLNLYNKTLSAAERAAAISHEQEASIRQVLGSLNGVRVYGTIVRSSRTSPWPTGQELGWESHTAVLLPVLTRKWPVYSGNTTKKRTLAFKLQSERCIVSRCRTTFEKSFGKS
jgi:hypothetical protein